MFPISTASLTTPGSVTPLAESAAVAAVQPDHVTAAGSATDAPPAASVTIALSPVANFLLTVSQSQEQLAQLQTAAANGAAPRDAAATLNDTTQNVVNAFNLLPAVDFDQAQPQGPSLLNQLVQSLQQQTFGNNATQPQPTAAQSLAQIGVTLQAPLLSDAAGGLSLDNEVLRASFNTNQQNTTQTLQNTLNSFSKLATSFAEQLSAAGTSVVDALAARQQASLSPAEVVDNAPPPALRPPIINPQQADNQASAQAADAAAAAQTARQQSSTNLSVATAAGTQAAAQAAIARNTAVQTAAVGVANAANTTAAQQATTEQDTAANLSAANAAAASADALAQAAQIAADALAAESAAASAAAQQALAAQIAATTPEAANAAAAVAAEQASAAQATAANLAAANAAAATAAQQAVAAQNAAAQAQAAQSAATQQATVQASTLQNDPLRANPALAAAIAAYNINDTGANAHTAQAAAEVIPRVPAVEAPARSRALGNAP